LNANESLLLSKIPTVDEMINYILDSLMQNYAVKVKELSPYRDTIRFDVLGINRNKGEIRIFEVKSCRRDFTSDKKWQSYLPYCTHFAFAAPKGVISKNELPKGVGLVEFWHLEDNSYLSTLCHEYTRGCTKLRDKVDEDKYISLLEAITMRLVAEQEEFRYYRYVLDKLDKIHNDLWSFWRDSSANKKT